LIRQTDAHNALRAHVGREVQRTLPHRDRLGVILAGVGVIMLRRFIVPLLLPLFVAGCAFFPNFEHTPSAHLPVSEVVNQIRCDMYEFLKDNPAGERNFSLDTKSYATVKLTLSTTAFGDVKFSRIDTIKLGAQGFLAVGGGVEPFPSFGVKQSNVVQAELVVNISQDKEQLREKCENGREYGYGEIFKDTGHEDRVLINDLRIASWLKRTFDRGDRIVHTGPHCNIRTKQMSKDAAPCSVGLETATLTTRFQLIGDMSGGVLNLAKLIPVIATPTLQLQADYYHQIQIIFSGNNAVDTAAREGFRGIASERGPSPPSVRSAPRQMEPCKGETDSESYKQCIMLRKLQRDYDALQNRLRELEQRRQDDGDASGASDAISRQLRSIRDTLILNGNRP